jgi:hypothetical protein
MKEGRPVLYFFIAMIVLMFYWVIKSHFIEIQEREDLIHRLQDTIIIQQQAIDIQKKQTELLLQFYIERTSEDNHPGPVYRRSI